MTLTSGAPTTSTGYEHYLVGAGSHTAVDLAGRTIVLDTNILLSLYSMHDAGLDDLLEGLRRVKEHLFLPAQVQQEFWRNRDQVLRRCRDESRAQGQRHQQVLTSALNLVSKARNRTFTPQVRKDWEQQTTAFFKDLGKATSDAALGSRAERYLSKPADDRIVAALDELFAGRVGAGPDRAELVSISAAFAERCASQTPPGYMDAHKADGGYGDYLVWTQVVDHARTARRPVVIVTNDLKEDWWRLRRANEPLNARFELVQELQEQASVGLDLLTFSRFLERLEDTSGIDFAESTIDEVDAVPSDERQQDDDAAPSWLVEQLAMLLQRLRDQDFAGQADVLHAAADHESGHLTREEVLRILGRAPDDKLTGFTRAITTAQRQLAEEGLLPRGLAPALAAEYDRPGKAQRFAVPAELVQSARGVSL